MTRSVRHYLSAFLLVCSLSSLCSGFALAAYVPPVEPDSSHYLDAYSVGMGAESGGVVGVGVDVSAVVNATEIGAKDIYIYEADSPTDFFTCVAHYDSDDYPNLLGSGYYYSRTAIRHSGTVGKYYYAAVYVYAGDSTGGDTRLVYTNTVAAHN